MMMVLVMVQVSDVYRKIRLTIRFLLGNVHDFDPSQHAVPYSQLPLTDRYLLARFAHLLQDAQTSYSQYQFPKVYQVACTVYWHVSSAWCCAHWYSCELDAALSQYQAPKVYRLPEVYQFSVFQSPKVYQFPDVHQFAKAYQFPKVYQVLSTGYWHVL